MKWLLNLVLWLLSFWEKIPQKTREKIVEIISEMFRKLLENFYDWIKLSEKNKSDKDKKEEDKNKAEKDKKE